MTPNEEMLVKYAKIVKNYCEDGYKEHKCGGCTFERKGHCLLYLHYDKCQRDFRCELI